MDQTIKTVVAFIVLLILVNASMLFHGATRRTSTLDNTFIRHVEDRVEDRVEDYFTDRTYDRTKKYVVWRKTGAGWGNRIMGMVKAVTLAMAFDRPISMRHDQYEACFEDPLTLHWFDRTVDVGKDFTLIGQEGYSKIPEEWLHILVKKGILKEPTLMNALMVIGRFLTRKPTKQLLAAVERVKTAAGIEKTIDMTVQIRTMKDYGPGHVIAMGVQKQEQIWDCIKFATSTSSSFYFTSDEIEMFNKVEKELSGKTFYVRHGMQHTSQTNELVPNSIAEWYIIGESSSVVCSRTSFCITAIARRYIEVSPKFFIDNTYTKPDVKCTKW